MKLIVILFWTGLYALLTWKSIENLIRHVKYQADIEDYTVFWAVITLLMASIVSVLVLASDL